jgi:hypothetical protein
MSRYGDQIGRLQRCEIGVGGDGEAGRGPHRAAVGGAQRELVAGKAVDGAVGAEDLAHHAELERGDPVEHDGGDALKHADSLARKWQ